MTLKPNQTYRTRGGAKVVILEIDNTFPRPAIGILKLSTLEERPVTYLDNGRHGYRESKLDLVELVK